ncbi:MAG: hypothetical protein ACYS47_04290 [Planctomycetota bacterium]|jgi:hypothetical protein
MKKAWGIMALTAAILLLLPISALVVGQEGGGSGKDPGEKEEKGAEKKIETGSGISVVVIQTEGEKTTVADLELKQEQLGIISLTLVPVVHYTLLKGKAVISIPIRKIDRIDIDGDIARVKGRGGEKIEGKVDPENRFFLFGKVAIGEYKIDLAHVKSLEFIHPRARLLQCKSCNRIYANLEWTYCPHDGAKLMDAE